MRRLPLPLRLALALLSAGAAALGNDALGAERNLLRNAGFEAGDDALATAWEARVDPSVSPPPVFAREMEGREGERCVTISGKSDGGVHALVQSVTDTPRSASVARLSGWVRVEAAGAAGAAGAGDTGAAAACLTLAFPEPDAEPGSAAPSRTFQTAEVGAAEVGAAEMSTGAGWVRIDMEVPVPRDARAWVVGCTFRGRGRACFDELLLQSSDQPKDLLGCVLALGSSRWIVEARDDAPSSWISFSVPLPFGGQTPLALRVTSDPPGLVERLELHPDRENRPLRVVLKPIEAGALVRLRADSVVLLRDRPLSSGEGVKLPPSTKAAAGGNLVAAAAKVPEAVREHLQVLPGTLPGDETMQNIVRNFSQRDLAALTSDLRTFLEFKLSTSEAGRKVRGVDPIDTSMTVSAQYATLAASLLIADGVPARILACTGVSGALQEHYLVEAWTPSLGWARLESTAAFPWGDTRNLVLRVVYPDAPRTQTNVPLFCEADPALNGYPGFAPETLFWQSGRVLGTFAVERADLEALEAAAREAFEQAVTAPVAEAHILFAPAAEDLPAAGARAGGGKSAAGAAGAAGAGGAGGPSERCRKLLEAAARELPPP